MRIPTAEAEIGIVTKLSDGSYWWSSLQDTYGMNKTWWREGRQMTFAEFKQLYPFSGYHNHLRYKTKPKKW